MIESSKPWLIEHYVETPIGFTVIMIFQNVLKLEQVRSLVESVRGVVVFRQNKNNALRLQKIYIFGVLKKKKTLYASVGCIPIFRKFYKKCDFEIW